MMVVTRDVITTFASAARSRGLQNYWWPAPQADACGYHYAARSRGLVDKSQVTDLSAAYHLQAILR